MKLDASNFLAGLLPQNLAMELHISFWVMYYFLGNGEKCISITGTKRKIIHEKFLNICTWKQIGSSGESLKEITFDKNGLHPPFEY